MIPGDGHVAIAGAGVAGLTAAIALSQAGFSVTLYERAERLEEVGAGLQLSPNATRILERLGVLDSLLPSAVRPVSVEMRKAAGLKTLANVPLGEGATKRWGAPYLTIHRADLQAALLAHAVAQARIELVTGATIRGAVARKGRVSLTIEKEGATRETSCALLVGADGVWSTLRKHLAGQGGDSRYTGYLAWRAMSQPAAGLIPADRVTAFVHPGFHLVAYPVRAGEAVNLVTITRSPASAERWSNTGQIADLTAAMRGASPALLDLVSNIGSWLTWPINEVPRDAPWIDPSGIVLIGDAAHALSPYAAQGAAMAIEDAASLVASLKRYAGDLGLALRAYESRRRQRIARVASRGAFNRFTWHAAGPVAIGRDLVLGLRSPERLAADLDWLYGFDAALID